MKQMRYKAKQLDSQIAHPVPGIRVVCVEVSGRILSRLRH